MSKRFLAAALLVALAGAGGWVLAQQAGPGPRPAPADAPKAAPGRYAVSGAGNGALLVDTATGRTWSLTQAGPVGGFTLWVPMARADSEKDVPALLRQERERQTILAKLSQVPR
jgi:hypothetical protein